MIVTFDKYFAPKLGPDAFERLGNMLLYPIVRGFGSLISVKTIGKSSLPFFSEKTILLCKRIICIVCCILAAPIACLLVLAGLISYTCSTTYQRTFKLFENHFAMRKQIQEDFLEKLSPIITLQKHLRSYVTRKPLIQKELFPEYKAICDAILTNDLSDITCCSKTEDLVYTSKRCPSLLFKKIGASRARQHIFDNMALNNCLAKTGVNSLQILPASCYKDFLIEEKSFGHGAIDTLIAYRLNPYLFDQAIKNLCKLLHFYHFPELFTKSSELPKASAYSKLLLGFEDSNPNLTQDSSSLNPIIYLTGIHHIVEEPTPSLAEKLSHLFPYHKSLIQKEVADLKAFTTLKMPIPKRKIASSSLEKATHFRAL